MLPSRCMMLPCMKIAVNSVIHGGIGVCISPGSVIWMSPCGVWIVFSDGSVTMSCPVRISFGTCT